MKKHLLAALVPVALIATPVAADHHSAADEPLAAAIAGDRRAQDRARDAWRHPAQTLNFFEVRPGQTVIDYMPSSGWYTRILVPFLGPDGRYIGVNPDASSPAGERFNNYVAGLSEKFPGQLAQWGLDGTGATGVNIDQLGTDLNGTVDRVLIFREMHNLHRNGLIHSELSRLHELLADDGLLGIVQHRAKPWAPASYTDGSKGYMRQQDVIGLVEAHGFDLVATSEINANPRDRADHPEGVWELSPNLRTGREALRGIGESDRMTLLFRKRA